MGKYKVKKTPAGFMFNLVAVNGEVIGTSETYTSKAACLNGVESVRTNAPNANIEDQTIGEIKKTPKFEIYMDKADEYRFRLKAVNGEIILKSEGYVSKAGCKNGIDSVRENADSEIVEE